MDSNKSQHQASVLQVSDNAKKATIASFPAATDDYRYLRKRASILCAVFNAQPVDISQEERCRAWNAIVDASNKKNATECPLIKGPIYIDYGVNLHVHPTSFINRDCYIADSPEIDIRIGANTLISVGVRLLGVTHPVDWRERQGRKGPSLAGDVTIGNDCFIGCGAIVLPGVTIGDGCVIGAGSVVTKSIPSYHVAIGNPARVVRKVAPDVADAPGLMYVDDGDRILASVQNSSEHKRSFQPISLRNGDRIHEEDQLSQKTSSIRGGMPDEGGKLSKVALNLVMIFLPLGAGYVLGWRSS